MKPGFTVRLRPTGPWRIGGDTFYRSDALYSAITGAMHLLGQREEWLAAGSAVRFLFVLPIHWQHRVGYAPAFSLAPCPFR